MICTGWSEGENALQVHPSWCGVIREVGIFADIGCLADWELDGIWELHAHHYTLYQISCVDAVRRAQFLPLESCSLYIEFADLDSLAECSLNERLTASILCISVRLDGSQSVIDLHKFTSLRQLNISAFEKLANRQESQWRQLIVASPLQRIQIHANFDILSNLCHPILAQHVELQCPMPRHGVELHQFPSMVGLTIDRACHPFTIDLDQSPMLRELSVHCDHPVKVISTQQRRLHSVRCATSTFDADECVIIQHFAASDDTALITSVLSKNQIRQLEFLQAANLFTPEFLLSLPRSVQVVSSRSPVNFVAGQNVPALHWALNRCIVNSTGNFLLTLFAVMIRSVNRPLLVHTIAKFSVIEIEAAIRHIASGSQLTMEFIEALMEAEVRCSLRLNVWHVLAQVTRGQALEVIIQRRLK